jgi:hypothetical protein
MWQVGTKVSAILKTETAFFSEMLHPPPPKWITRWHNTGDHSTGDISELDTECDTLYTCLAPSLRVRNVEKTRRMDRSFVSIGLRVT